MKFFVWTDRFDQQSVLHKDHRVFCSTTMFFTLLVLFLFIAVPVISSNEEVPVDRGLNWYESLPAVAMDYKVHIDAGKLKT